MNLDYCRTFKSETKFMNSSYPQLPTPVVGVPRRCCCSPPGQSRASWAFGDWRLEGWLEISTPTDAVIWERQQETVWNRRERGRSWFISTSVEGRCGTNLFGDSCIYISWFEDQFFYFFLPQSSLIDAAPSCYGSKNDPLVSSVSTLFTTCEVH